MKVAVFGATGLVGGRMLTVLEERNFPVTELIPIASERSAGKKVTFQGKEWTVVTPQVGLEMGPQLAIFSAGGQTSLDWAPKFAETGCYVVDNSSAWRMDPTKKLVIPEINADVLTPEDRIIANPNCSTIQMLMALAPIYRTYGIRRIVVSTYQAITGTGMRAVTQMENERNGIMDGPMIYPHVIDRNCIPQCDSFTDNGYTKEEMKLVNETHKIFGDDSILVSPTAIRVPVVGAAGWELYEGRYTPPLPDKVIPESDEVSWSSDNEEDLYARLDIANQNNALLLVSIHCNAAESDFENISGIEVYANPEQSESMRLAESINQHLSDTDLNVREMKDGSVYHIMVFNNDLPVALVETGFLTNSYDLAHLTSPYGQSDVALEVAHGILDYLGMTYE